MPGAVDGVETGLLHAQAVADVVQPRRCDQHRPVVLVNRDGEQPGPLRHRRGVGQPLGVTAQQVISEIRSRLDKVLPFAVLTHGLPIPRS